MNNSIFNQKPGETTKIGESNEETLTRNHLVSNNNSSINLQINNEKNTNIRTTPSGVPIVDEKANAEVLEVSGVNNSANLNTVQNTNQTQISSSVSMPNNGLNTSQSIKKVDPFVPTTPSGKPIVNGEAVSENVKPNTGIVNGYISDEQYLRAYVGENYDKISSGKFSYPAFFLTYVYLYYRKMYGFGLFIQFLMPIILAIVYVAIFLIMASIFQSPTILFAISIVVLFSVNFVLGSRFNDIYIENARNKIKKFKFQYAGDPQRLLTICEQKGGTDLFKAILIYLAPTILSIAITIYVIAKLGLSIVGNTTTTSDSYNGIMSYGPEGNVTTNFSLTVPSVFEQDGTDYTYDINYDTDNLKFENAQAFYERANNRVLADSRGSIRQANGTVHDSKSFEEAKREVYSIALP